MFMPRPREKIATVKFLLLPKQVNPLKEKAKPN